MQNLSNVSLICVETRYPDFAKFSIDRCLAAAQFKECLLLTSVIHDLPDYIQQIKIDPLDSIAAYSELMIKKLGQYFTGSHVLIVQWDSFILHGEAWSDTFLEYDYIGAPWNHRPVIVGNGGFSLRSRKLYDVLSTLDIDQCHPEDRVICEQYGANLTQQHGIRFAPPELAAKFSYENTQPSEATFGFHGFFNFHRVMSESSLISYISKCDDATMRSNGGRGLYKNLLRGGHKRMAEAVLKRRLNGKAGMLFDTIVLRLRNKLGLL